MRKKWRATAAALLMCLVTPVTVPPALGAEPRDDRRREDRLVAKLADAYRVDLDTIRVTFDYWPASSRVHGTAVLRFRMRDGQRRAVFHFNPLRSRPQAFEQRSLKSLELDGEALDPADPDDVRRIRAEGAAEPAFEIRRKLTAGVGHTLRITWELEVPVAPRGWFYPTFDDTEGPDGETETLWPTVSSPEEFARHRIRLRVHEHRPYTMLGSGRVHRDRRDSRDGVQAWVLDTGRRVASHTVFFAAVPARDVRSTTFRVAGVDVRIVSDRGKPAVRRATRTTRDAIRQLVGEFGPFPMPRMQILLTRWGSGMEYYGATRTGIGALEHELGHMYFGAATVNRTWRDTWFDESAVVWWEDRRRLRPVGSSFSSQIARGRSAVAPGFDKSAYSAGARVLATIARALGGHEAMLTFLSDLHRRRAFAPFTTQDLIDDVVAAQNQITRTDLERWLLGY